MLALLLVASLLEPQDVITPPVLKGVRGTTQLYRKGPLPFPEPGQKWLRVQTPNFTIITTSRRSSAEQIASNLEQLAAALRRVNPRFDAKAAETRMFLFGRRRDSQPYFDLLFHRLRAQSTGAFVAHRDGSGTMIVDAGHAFATNRTVYHELMHNILTASGSRLPTWLEEGIAEYFSTAEMRHGALTIGRPIRDHQRVIQDRNRSLLPIADVFAATGDSPIVAHTMFYPQAWAVVDWLIRTDRDAFYDFVAGVEDGATVEASLRKHYATEPKAIQHQLQRGPARPVASATLSVPERNAEVTTEVLSEADALNELGRFVGLLETTREDAERFLRRALELEPKHARATAALGLLSAWNKDFDEATPLLEEALRLAPNDPVVLLDFGQVLLQNALGPFAGIAEVPPDAAPRFRRARELAQRALRNGGDPALAEAVIGTSYLVEEDASSAVPALRRAYAARPGRHDFALNLYAVLLRDGQRDDADRFFAATFARSRSPESVLAARAAFVREQLTRVNRFVKDENIDEAVKVMREMIEVTPDPVAKAELEQQLETLTAVAAANRQITAYNEAVDATNRGEHKTSLELLDKLLETATDERIIGQARDLREIVRKRVRRPRTRSSGGQAILPVPFPLLDRQECLSSIETAWPGQAGLPVLH